jgi:uroporphyrinogen decarboxylase
MPVTRFKEKYGGRIAVLGGVDMDKLTLLPVEEFRPYCRHVLEDCMTGGGYALGTGNSPATFVRLENFYAMHEIGLAYGSYEKEHFLL